MAKTTLHITIPEPCQEDWSKMSPTQCGAFCQACQKEVIDFSLMSEAEIVYKLSKASGKVCGRIATDKLNRELVKHEPDHAWYSWKKWAVAAGVLLGTGEAKANVDTNPKPADVATLDTVGIKSYLPENVVTVTHCAPTLEEEAPAPYLPAGEIITLTGWITDEQNQPLPFAQVSIMNTDIIATADVRGVYTLYLPAENYYNKIQQITAHARMYNDSSSYVFIDSLYKEANLNVAPSLSIVRDELKHMIQGGFGYEIVHVSRFKFFFLRIADRIKQAKRKREDRRWEKEYNKLKAKANSKNG